MAVSKSAAAAELGGRLAALRKVAGLSLRGLEARAGVSNPRISMWENGRRLPTAEDLDMLLDGLDADADQREQLHALLREANGPGALSTGSPAVGEQLNTMIEHERRAARITDVAPLLIPGLLQTSSYAYAIFGSHSAATLRSGRRDILTRRKPVEFVALIDSEVLVRPVAPADVMLEQLRHLLDMAERPNITVQLWSSTRQGWHPGLTGPYLMLEFAASRPIVHVEHHSSSAFIWEAADVQSFKEAAELLQNEVAMSPARSAELIAEIADGMETT